MFDLIETPSNLGLRPNPAGALVGTWRAAAVLREQGLDRAFDFRARTIIPAAPYEREAQPGTRIRNGQSLRAFNIALARAAAHSLESGAFPLVVGGDCSNVLGCLLGLRNAGGRGLVHLDGHSDFFHPGNYDSTSRLGSAAGMDLALATGRGEPILTEWPGVEGPLVADGDIVQIGERERGDPDYPFGEIPRTDIAQVTAQEIRARGLDYAIDTAIDRLERRNLHRAWLHIDLDVLDEAVMPAVDSPGSPGLTYEELALFVRALLATGRIAGADVAIYDPDLDPNRIHARGVVSALTQAFRPNWRWRR